MLDKLLTEQVNPASRGIDAMPTLDVVRIINQEDAKVAGSIAGALPQIATAVDAIVAAFQAGGRLFYIGAGTSGRLGVLDAAECPPTFGVPPDWVQGIIAGGEAALARATEATEDDPAAGVRDLLDRGFSARDVLVGIAASGRTPYVLGAIAEAKRLGAVTAGISCTPDSALAAAVGIPITVLPGAEIVAGSTRMKAGTATKLVLNMLSTGSFIRMGYVFDNLMVNVQPRNEKLRDRACRIVSSAAQIPEAASREALAAAGGSVRAAILIAVTGVEPAQAETLLTTARGSVSAALRQWRGQ